VTDRILTTHTGSLIRPAEVLELGESRAGTDPEAVLSAAVADVVRKQAEAGIDIVDDGEMGKSSWITYLYERLSGIEPRMVPLEGISILPPSRDRQAFPEFYAELDVEFARAARSRVQVSEGSDADAPTAVGKLWFCTGPIAYDPAALQRDVVRLRAALTDVDVVDAFLPVVAPASVYWLRNEYYPSEDELVFAVADALHEEYAAIVDAGFLLQVDDAVLMHEYDSILSEGGSVDDYRRWATLRVDALNHALRGIPPERVRYHVCFGSWHGPHMYDPPLADVIDLILAVNAGYYLIEQANSRHEHEWRLWEEVALPDDKVLVPGVVTHHTNVVEHPELVAERLVRLAGLVGRDRVMAGTDCGFAQSAGVRRVHPSIQWAKLAALAEGARLATSRLWGTS
jgi:5-methyltetrahydropteroyltriglutamate--homocysteine methyltransferase